MDELNPLQPVKPLKKYSGEAGGEELSPERKRYVAFVVITAALTASSLGYDVGVMAGAMDGLEETFALSDFEIEVVIGAMNFVAAIGALFAGNTADRFGRKASLGICCFLYLVGGGLMTGAPNYASLLAGRIITGVGVGLAFVIGPVYISEITPPELRGVLATVFDVSINLGILSGYVASFVLENTLPDAPQSLKWRAMIGFGNVFPLVVSFLLIRLPESPRWLTMKGRRRDAEKVLSSILGIDEGNQQAIALSLAAIEEENKIDAESASWLEVISPPEPHVRHAVGVAFGIGFWQQITGTEAVLYYSANFLEEAGLTSTNLRLLGNMLVGLSKLLPEFWVMSSINSRGRRWHMILSAGSMTVSLALLGAAFGLGLPSWTVILFLCCFMASFSLGAGPFAFVIASEILPLHYRAKGMSINTCINRGVSGAVALTALSITRAVGEAAYFFGFAAISFVSIGFYLRQVPETCGKSLEGIQTELKHDGRSSVVRGFCFL